MTQKEKLQAELIRQLGLMTNLVRLKYGNLDKDIYSEIEKSEKLLESISQLQEGEAKDESFIITVEQRTEEIISSNPFNIHQSRLEGWQFREAIRFLAKQIDILHNIRIKNGKTK